MTLQFAIMSATHKTEWIRQSVSSEAREDLVVLFLEKTYTDTVRKDKDIILPAIWLRVISAMMFFNLHNVNGAYCGSSLSQKKWCIVIDCFGRVHEVKLQVVLLRK